MHTVRTEIEDSSSTLITSTTRDPMRNGVHFTPSAFSPKDGVRVPASMPSETAFASPHVTCDPVRRRALLPGNAVPARSAFTIGTCNVIWTCRPGITTIDSTRAFTKRRLTCHASGALRTSSMCCAVAVKSTSRASPGSSSGRCLLSRASSARCVSRLPCTSDELQGCRKNWSCAEAIAAQSTQDTEPKTSSSSSR